MNIILVLAALMTWLVPEQRQIVQGVACSYNPEYKNVIVLYDTGKHYECKVPSGDIRMFYDADEGIYITVYSAKENVIRVDMHLPWYYKSRE